MITAVGQQKANGAYDTPEPVARTLVRWVVRHEGDRLLDPSCGDGRFLEHRANSVGVEFDAAAAVAANGLALNAAYNSPPQPDVLAIAASATPLPAQRVHNNVDPHRVRLRQ